MPIEDKPAIDGATDTTPLIADDDFSMNGEDTFDDALAGADLATDLESGHKRRPGRAPGSPKIPGSGRQKGSKNIVSTKTKETVTDIFDRYGPLAMQRLFNVAFGRKIRVGAIAGPNPEYVYPSEANQMKALEILARKLRADLASQQITGKDGKDLFQPAGFEGDNRQIARAVIQVLGAGVVDAHGINGIAPGSSPAGRETLGAAAPAAPGATPDAVSVNDDSPSGSPADPPYIEGGVWAGRERGRDGAESIQKKNQTQNKNQNYDIAYPGGEPVPKPTGEPKPELVGSQGHYILRRQVGAGGGCEKFLVHDQNGQHVCSTRDHAEAVLLCQELASTGRVTR